MCVCLLRHRSLPTKLSSPEGLGTTHRPFGVQANYDYVFVALSCGLALVTYWLLVVLQCYEQWDQ